MIAQLLLTAFLALVLVYAWSAHRTVPIIGLLAGCAALAGLYFVWVPEHATALAAFVGIGRGSDLIVYTWVVISLLIMLNLHLKLRLQLDMITRLARAVAIDRAKESRREAGPPRKRRPVNLGRKAEAPPIELQTKK
jgi:small membrane protein